jgi:hypothetical protein
MGKLGLTAILLLGAAVVADRYFNYGRHTDGVIATLRQIQRTFGL